MTYYGKERNRSFNVYVNNTLLKYVALDGASGDQFIDIGYFLPSEVAKSSAIVVKFIASANSAIAKKLEMELALSFT